MGLRPDDFARTPQRPLNRVYVGPICGHLGSYWKGAQVGSRIMAV